MRRIFELCAERRRPDAHHEGAERGRRARATPAAGAARWLGASSVRAVLRRPLYMRGGGLEPDPQAGSLGRSTSTHGPRPNGCASTAPDLRIVSDDLWAARARSSWRGARQQYACGRSRRPAVAVSALWVCPLCALWRRIRLARPDARARARVDRAVLRLHVALEARRDGLRQRPRRPHGRHRRGGARDAARTTCCGRR